MKYRITIEVEEYDPEGIKRGISISKNYVDYLDEKSVKRIFSKIEDIIYLPLEHI